MKTFYLDTNYILRFILADSKEQFIESKKLFQSGVEKKVRLVILSQIVFELDFILRRVYKFNKAEVVNVISTLFIIPTVKISNAKLLLSALEVYKEENLSLVDSYLHACAHANNAKIATFDKKLRKLSVHAE